MDQATLEDELRFQRGNAVFSSSGRMRNAMNRKTVVTLIFLIGLSGMPGWSATSYSFRVNPDRVPLAQWESHIFGYGKGVK